MWLLEMDMTLGDHKTNYWSCASYCSLCKSLRLATKHVQHVLLYSNVSTAQCEQDSL